jgi:hypothetical protein
MNQVKRMTNDLVATVDCQIIAMSKPQRRRKNRRKKRDTSGASTSTQLYVTGIDNDGKESYSKLLEHYQ